MSIAQKNRLPEKYLVKDVQFENDSMLIFLKCGYIMAFDLYEFPRLKKASSQQKRNWELIGNGVGIHWEKIDEDLSAEGLLKSHLRYTSRFTKKVQKLIAA